MSTLNGIEGVTFYTAADLADTLNVVGVDPSLQGNIFEVLSIKALERQRQQLQEFEQPPSVGAV